MLSWTAGLAFASKQICKALNRRLQQLQLSSGDVQVQYSSLPNYEEKEEDFRAEAYLLRRRFTEEGARALAVIAAVLLS